MIRLDQEPGQGALWRSGAVCRQTRKLASRVEQKSSEELLERNYEARLPISLMK